MSARTARGARSAAGEKQNGGMFMFNKIRNSLKNKKGFTLVELIVVLVILGILAALLVPALTGYIDRAKKQSALAETRQVVMAAQTLVSEKYGSVKVGTDIAANAVTAEEIKTLAEVKAGASVDTLIVSKYISGNSGGKIVYLNYTSSNGVNCEYYPAGNTTDGNSDGDYNIGGTKNGKAPTDTDNNVKVFKTTDNNGTPG